MLSQGMNHLISKILSASLVLLFLLGFCGLPTVAGVFGSNPNVQEPKAACGMSVCCCLDGSDPSNSDACEMKKLSADEERGGATARFTCSLRPSNCDPTRGISVPTVFKDILPPAPSTQASSLPKKTDFDQTAILVTLSDYKVSIFHPPCV
jgi:hypothetical protein